MAAAVALAVAAALVDQLAGHRIVRQLEDSSVSGQQLDPVAHAPWFVPVVILVRIVASFEVGVDDGATKRRGGPVHDHCKRQDLTGGDGLACTIVIIGQHSGRDRLEEERKQHRQKEGAHAEVLSLAPEPAMNGGLTVGSDGRAHTVPRNDEERPFMLLKFTQRTIVAALLIALLAFGWQLVTGGGGADVRGPATIEKVHHDDD